MGYTLGIDVGSSYLKAALCQGTALLSYVILPSGGNYEGTARRAADEVIRQAGIRADAISVTVATGYGAAAVPFADRTATDISCHAAGIHHLFPDVRTIIDVGGQFTRAIRIDQSGKAISFVQNEKCAAGSGKFLQVIARILHVSLEDLGQLSLKSANPVEFTTGCAVFAESEVVSRISEGARPEDIISGVHKAMAAKIVNLVVRIGLAEECAVTGGGAKDIGLVKTIEGELGIGVKVAEEPRISAALGAALQGI